MLIDPTIVIVFGSLLIALLSSLGYAYWHQTFKYKTSKRGLEDGASSLKVSELEELIRHAMEEALRPFEKRFAEVEAEIHSLHATISNNPERLTRKNENYPLLQLSEEEEEDVLVRTESKKRVR